MGAPEDLRNIRDKLRTGMFGNRETWERQLEAGADEIARLQEAKRKFSLLCDEKGAENVKLRAALDPKTLASVIAERIVGLDLTNVERARVAANDAATAIVARAFEQEGDQK